jgi:hypothetical protein
MIEKRLMGQSFCLPVAFFAMVRPEVPLMEPVVAQQWDARVTVIAQRWSTSAKSTRIIIGHCFATIVWVHLVKELRKA